MSEPRPCERCGVDRTLAQGGCVFTICDKCWDDVNAFKCVFPGPSRMMTTQEWVALSPQSRRIVNDWEQRYQKLPVAAKVIAQNLREDMSSHRTPGDRQYNQCEKNPCAWCDDVQDFIDAVAKCEGEE